MAVGNNPVSSQNRFSYSIQFVYKFVELEAVNIFFKTSQPEFDALVSHCDADRKMDGFRLIFKPAVGPGIAISYR